MLVKNILRDPCGKEKILSNIIFRLSLRSDMHMKTILLFFTILYSVLSFGQIGGTKTFALLDLTFSARGSGLGGDFVTAKDQDISLGVANPSLLNAKMHNELGISQAFHAGKINYGMLAYGRSLKKERFISAHLRYVSFGNMKRTEVNGEVTGQFNPFEYIAGVGFGQQLNPRISVGGNLNVIGSHMESYNSYGASIDLGGTFTSTDEALLVTAMVKNAGVQFYSYNDERAPLPINFQIGTSYKVKHAPFRFSVLVHHLNKWDLTYNDPNLKPTIDPLSGDTIPVKRAGFGEKLAQHFTFGLEVLASKNIHLRAGFNYYARQSLKVTAKPGIAGLSFGAGFYFKRFALDYGFTAYSKAGFNHMLTLSANLSKIKI